MERMSRSLLAVVAMAAMFDLTSCKKTAPGGAGSESKAFQGPQFDVGNNVSVGAGRTFAHVMYKPEVKVVEQGAVDSSIEGISTDGHGVAFKNAPPEILALKAGDVFLAKNAFAVKVLAAETDGDETVLVTDEARLADVVQQGEINVDSPVSFHGPKESSALQVPARPFSLLDLIETPAYAQSGITVRNPSEEARRDFIKNMVMSGWKVEQWQVTPAGSTANIKARMTKDTGGFKAAVSVDGSITDFQFVANLKMPPTRGSLVKGVQGMSGQMHFMWEIGKDTPGVWAVEDKIKLPAGIVIPLRQFVAGLPMDLEISSAFLIHPALTGGNEYSKGGFTIGWVGSQSAEAVGIETGASDGTEGLTFQITDDANVSPIAPNGMVISFCAPRVELRLSLLGEYSRVMGFKVAAGAVDAAVGKIAKKLLSPTMLDTISASPLGKMSVSNTLASSADVYVQIIHTEGVTHASNLTPTPCSKLELKVVGQVGGDARLFGLTNAATTHRDTFTKTYTEWRPGSKFCKSL
jgi:hypothetical protein